MSGFDLSAFLFFAELTEIQNRLFLLGQHRNETATIKFEESNCLP